MSGCSSWPETLSKHRWQDRVILVFASSKIEPYFLEQLEILKSDHARIRERDLVIYEITDYSDALASKYNPKQPFTFILIGKDGGEKLRRNKPVSLSALYATIDAMPMRKQEISAKN